MPSAAALLRAARPLRNVDVEARGLTRLFVLRPLPAGAAIGPGEVAVIVDGYVHYRSRVAGRDVHELLGPGDLVGIDAFLGRDAAAGLALAAGACRLLVADLDLTRLALHGDRAFAGDLVRLIVERVRATRALIELACPVADGKPTYGDGHRP